MCFLVRLPLRPCAAAGHFLSLLTVEKIGIVQLRRLAVRPYDPILMSKRWCEVTFGTVKLTQRLSYQCPHLGLLAATLGIRGICASCIAYGKQGTMASTCILGADVGVTAFCSQM